MGGTDVIPYLEKVIAMDPGNPYLQERLEQLLHPAVPNLPEEDVSEVAAEPAEPVAESRPIPICGISR